MTESRTSDAPPISIQVRDACLDDVPELVTLHLACFSTRDHLLMLFGDSVLHSAYRWFVGSRNTFTVVATSAERIVGLCTACRGPYNRPMVIHSALALL
jgi:hypothetical protein